MTARDQERERAINEGRRTQEERQKSYRQRALKMYPWVCGKCSREFSGKKVRELTVHHRDHNHDNNPPDGSNWEPALHLLPRQRTPARYRRRIRRRGNHRQARQAGGNP